MKIYDRHKNEYIETEQYGQGKLEFLYGTALGRILLKIVISPFTSKIYGFYNGLPVSAKKIPAFIEKYNIDISKFEKSEYHSFNDFFTRKLRSDYVNIEKKADILISPADSKLLVYNISDDLKILVKGSIYTLDELVKDKVDISGFGGGLCLVFRLCMDDYHRYCFVDNGKIVTMCDTEQFGQIVHIEVGALLVGRIVNHVFETFTKGDEKGYFEPGGSTIVLLLKKNKAEIDDDIIKQSKKEIETIVKYGERIGKKSHA